MTIQAKYLKYIIVSLSLWMNSITLVHAGSREGTPIGKELNKIINSHYGSLAKSINKLIKYGAKDSYLKRFSDEDKLVYKELIIKLRAAKLVAKGEKHSLVLKYTGGSTSLELVDLLSNQYKVNGRSFHFSTEASFSENLERAVGLFQEKKKKTSTTFIERLFFIEEAHAFAFLAVPIWALIAGGSVAVATDTIVSSSANDISNSLNPDIRMKIQKLEAKFKERANQCEADLGRLYSGDRAVIQGNSSVKIVATLIEELGAELEDTWFDGDGKEQINYNKLGCVAYHGKDGMRTDQVFGIIPGGWHGKVVKPLCHEQERLNKCFENIEDIMRDKDIAINDIQKDRSSAPSYEGLIDEYKDLSGVIKN